MKRRIMYNSPVQSEFQANLGKLIWQAIKAVGIGILITLFLIEIWALFWFLCALDDVCYAANTGGL